MSIGDLSILEHVQVPSFVIELDDDLVPRYRMFNARMLHLTQLSAAQVQGKSALEVFPGAQGERAYRNHMRVITNGTVATVQMQLPVGDRFRHVITTLSPIRDARGKVVQVVGTVDDITDLENAQEQQATLHTLAREMEDFVAMAAHDLRTPMRNVKNLVEMLREDFEDMGDGKLDLIDLLGDVAAKAGILINDVLAHARAVNAEPDIEEFGLSALCDNLVQVLDPFGKHKVHWPDAVLKSDKVALQIALRNLIDNAIKHGGREHLEIELLLDSVRNGQLQFTLRDNGVGFENPGLAFLDGGQFRIDSGYGLLGVQRLIEARGGQICAANRDDGQGSNIYFSLPGERCLAVVAA